MQGRFTEESSQDLFRMQLEQMINLNHPLVLLSKKLNWMKIEKELSTYYSSVGRPSVPIRIMVSLLLLKHLENLSDEKLIEQWIQNPYYQYFSGKVYFEWVQPCASSELVHFRHRIGETGITKIFAMTVEIHEQAKEETEILMDTTVQEKNITFPTDTKLQNKIIEKCNEIAKEEGLKLKQSFKFVKKKVIKSMRMNRLQRTKSQRSATQKARRKLKSYAKRIVKDVKKQLELKDKTLLSKYAEDLHVYESVLAQKQDSKNKYYSLHEREVQCISKGKEHKKYEFGNKVGIAVGRKTGLILGVISGRNEYDGKFIAPLVEQAKSFFGIDLQLVIADRGCKGRKTVGETKVLLPDDSPRADKTASERNKLKKAFRDRAGIEPRIGHLKADHRLNKNFLKGTLGDMINVTLACAAFNLKKFLNGLFFALFCLQKNAAKNKGFLSQNLLLAA